MFYWTGLSHCSLLQENTWFFSFQKRQMGWSWKVLLNIKNLKLRYLNSKRHSVLQLKGIRWGKDPWLSNILPISRIPRLPRLPLVLWGVPDLSPRLPLSKPYFLIDPPKLWHSWYSLINDQFSILRKNLFLHFEEEEETNFSKGIFLALISFCPNCCWTTNKTLSNSRCLQLFHVFPHLPLIDTLLSTQLTSQSNDKISSRAEANGANWGSLESRRWGPPTPKAPASDDQQNENGKKNNKTKNLKF